MISTRMQCMLDQGQAMADIFTAGDRLAKRFGADNVYDFSLGNPNVPAPETVKNTIIESLNTYTSLELHGYTKPEGYSEVRRKIAEHDREKFGVDLSEKNIFMTAGAAGGLNVIMNTFLNPGDEVIVTRPYFGEYSVYVGNAGGKIVEVDAVPGTFELDVEAIKKRITHNTKVVLVNTPNNPTGVIYSEESLRDLAYMLNKKNNDLGIDILLVSDEPYRDIVYDNSVVPYIPKFYDNTIVAYSFSKSLSLPGERIGYISVPNEIVDAGQVRAALATAIRTLFVNAPSMMQRVAAACINDECNVAYYANNAKIMYEGLTDIGFECVKPQGAFYLWMKSPLEDEREFARLAEDYQIIMIPGCAFAGSGYVRLSFCVATEKIKESMKHFKELYHEVKNK